MPKSKASANGLFPAVFYQAVLDLYPLGVFLTDARGLCRYTNDTFRRICGLSSQKAVRVYFDKVLFPEDREEIENQWQECLAERRNLDTIHRLRRPGGETAWVRVVAQPITVEGRFVGFAGVLEDISDRKLSEDIAVQLSNMQQRELFMSLLAHDLKTPLLGADRLLGLLLAGIAGELDAPQAELIAKLKESNKTLLKMIQKLLDVYRYETGSETLVFEPVELLTLVSECLDEIAPLAGARNVRLAGPTPSSALTVRADGLAMRRVVTNLLSNAVKFSQQGSIVEISQSREDSHAVLRVKNYGAGIPIEEQQKLFKPFWQGEPGRRYAAGTGLGLYLCRRIVEAHDGEISVESEPDKHTVFIVKLPLPVSGADFD